MSKTKTVKENVVAEKDGAQSDPVAARNAALARTEIEDRDVKMRLFYSEESERAVLGSILADMSEHYSERNESFLEKARAAGLAPLAFRHTENRKLYETLCKVIDANPHIDPIGFLGYLRDNDLAERFPNTLISDLIGEGKAYFAEFEYHVERLLRLWYGANMNKALAEAIQRVNFLADAQATWQMMEEDVSAILGEVKPVAFEEGESFADSVAHVGTDLKDLVLHGPAARTGLPTGLPALDRKLPDGLQPGNLVIVAARPSVGKTALAMNIAAYLAANENCNGAPFVPPLPRGPARIGVFSLEMSQDDLVLRLQCARAGIDRNRYRRLEGAEPLSEEEQVRACAAVDKATAEIASWDIVVDATGGLDVEAIRLRARRWHRKKPLDLLVVDYIQLAACKTAANQGRQLETAAISKGLKTLAKELGIPVIALSQLSRENAKQDRDPVLSDLRDSGAIEQDADIVIFLSRILPDQDDPSFRTARMKMKLDVAKNRQGETGYVNVDFIGAGCRFVEHDECACQLAYDEANATRQAARQAQNSVTAEFAETRVVTEFDGLDQFPDD